MSLQDYLTTLPSHFPPDQCTQIAPAAPSYSGTSTQVGSDTAGNDQETAVDNDALLKPTATSTDISKVTVPPLDQPVAARFADITEIQSRNLRGGGNQIVLTERFCPTPKRAEREKRKFEEYSVLLRNVVQKQRKCFIPVETVLEIRSKTLCREFRRMAPTCYDDTDLDAKVIKIRFPFSELFFHREAIEAFASDPANPEHLRREMKLLSDFIHDPKRDLAHIIKNYERNIAEGKVDGQELWTIYPPNEIVVFNEGRYKEFWICRNVLYKSRGYCVSGLRLDFDGERLGLARQECFIPMRGQYGISQLPLIPASMSPDWDRLQEKLRRRAEVFKALLGNELTGFGHRSYKGPLWRTVGVRVPLNEVNERLIVDYSMFLSENCGQRADLVSPKPKKKIRRKPLLPNQSSCVAENH
ncbi:hypothetical protein VTN96DRAFT_3080 [Rasamsonia emersonii]